MADLQKFLDELVTANHVTSAAIVGRTGSPNIVSPGFAITADEIKHISEGFDKPDTLSAKGVMLHGKKYIFLGKSPDGNCLRTKLDKGGAILVKTGKHIIIGLYDEKIGAGNCVKYIESTGDKMKKAGL